MSSANPRRSRIGTTYADKHDDQPARIVTPSELGDDRFADGAHDAGTAPSTLDRLLHFGDDLVSLGEYVRDLRNVVTEALQRTLWVSDARLNNTAGATITIGGVQYAWGVGFVAQIGAAVVLRHIQVGASTAGYISLYASRTPGSLALDGRERALGTVRVTANSLTAYPAIEPILDSDECLLVVLQAAAGNLDFSCEYHTLRAGA